MQIHWDSTLSTGVAQIDEQHQKLINALNTLVDAMRQGCGKEKIEPMLAWLGDYATMHFGFEESCMDRHRCPVAGANRLAHAQFIQVFGDLRKRYQQQGASTSLVLEVEQKLGVWVREHIRKVDTNLGKCVAHAA